MRSEARLGEVAQVLRAAGLLREVRGPEDTVVSGVTHDSREVSPGDLFLAWKGTALDAHDFVPAARRAGAAAALVERPVEEAGGLPQLVVSNGRHAAALAADAVFGFPARRLRAVAITGTNGKTTSALLARHLLSELPGGAASLGTLGVFGTDGELVPGSEGLTTPDPVGLARTFRTLADREVGVVTLEASSHALDQHRLDALRPEVAVFTNLSRDHLDYHGDLESYRAAKLRLLELLASDGTAVINAAEPAWEGVRAHRTLSYGVQTPADLRAENVVLAPSGTRFTLHHQGQSVPVDLPLLGAFNVANALAAAGAALVLGLSLEQVAQSLESVPQIPGRMERVVASPFVILIDFAHTPDALENLLKAVKAVTRGRLLVLFGAGGDRDRGKRRPMAQAVARFADEVFLTSDNPRTEDPEQILDDLEPGLGKVARHRNPDRRAAIREAIARAEPGDVVVLAGKGHERYQVVGAERVPFDERTEVAAAMKLRGAA